MKDAAERQETLSKVKICGATYVAPRFSEFRGDKVMIRHQQGVSGIPLADLSDTDVAAINSLEMVLKSRVTVGGANYHNPVFKSIEEGAVTLGHAGGRVRLPTDGMSAPDIVAINKLSDGTWKIGPTGLSGFDPSSGSYKELLLVGGKRFTSFRMTGLVGEQVACITDSEVMRFSLVEAAALAGLNQTDQRRIDDWSEEVFDSRKEQAPIRREKEIVRFVPALDPDQPIMAVTADVMQVPDGGVLVSSFVGSRFKGTNELRIKSTRSYTHPLTGRVFTETVETKNESEKLSTALAESLCFIACGNENVVDGQSMSFTRLVRTGTYQYTAINGAIRTVPRYDEK